MKCVVKTRNDESLDKKSLVIFRCVWPEWVLPRLWQLRSLDVSQWQHNVTTFRVASGERRSDFYLTPQSAAQLDSRLYSISS